jgi:hypothetical protein
MTLGKALLHAKPTMETTETRSQYYDRGMADTAGPAPRPLDGLDGHLVMAHGTDITNRAPSNVHYLTMNQAHFRNLKEKKVLDGTAEGNFARTELMRKKALMRAAGVEPWDPKAVVSIPSLPMTVKPTIPVAVGSSPAETAAQHYASVTQRTLGTASTLSATTQSRPAQSFSRDGAFTKTFKTFLPKEA